MTRINTNVPALRTLHNLLRNQNDLNTRLERLSTGLRINRGSDDPAGLIVSERLRADMRGMEQAIKNGERANNLLSTAEGAMNEVSALLLELQTLVVSASNDAGLADSEIAANQLQIDSILESIDRISNTTTFGGEKVLNGEKAYILSGVLPTAVPSVSIYGAHLPAGGSREVVVRVTQSAQTAQLAFVGTNTTGTSTTSATTVDVAGELGRELLSFASGVTLAQIRTVINSLSEVTGVSAVVSATATPGVASALLLNSVSYGSDAFVSVEAIGGGFIAPGNSNTTARAAGVDAGVLVNGQTAQVQGVRADVRAGALDARIILSETFAQSLSSVTFSITGGGAVFQITPDLTPNGQINVGFDAVSTSKLGNAVVGRLHTLRSDGANALASRNFRTAQTIVEESVQQLASYRARLGNIQKNHVESSINSQRVALENVTASESLIRDAAMAVEVSAMTRAQILVQSTVQTLQIAQSAPAAILSLLG